MAALCHGLAPVRPAVGGQPQADGVGDGLGNVQSGRIRHPRGEPLVADSLVRTHYPGPVPARTTPTPPNPSRTTTPIPSPEPPFLARKAQYIRVMDAWPAPWKTIQEEREKRAGTESG